MHTCIGRRMRYDKLVRDNIPQIIKDNGDTPVIHQAEKEEYEQKLKEKLEEEVEEFLQSENKEELADILEVIRSLLVSKNISWQELEALRREKAEERGSFKNKIILEETK